MYCIPRGQSKVCKCIICRNSIKNLFFFNLKSIHVFMPICIFLCRAAYWWFLKDWLHWSHLKHLLSSWVFSWVLKLELCEKDICHTRSVFLQCAFFHASPSNISSRMIYCILSKNLVFLRCEHYEPLCENAKKSGAQMTLDMFGMKKVFLQNVPSHDFSSCYCFQMSFGIWHKRTFSLWNVLNFRV